MSGKTAQAKVVVSKPLFPDPDPSNMDKLKIDLDKSINSFAYPNREWTNAIALALFSEVAKLRTTVEEKDVSLGIAKEENEKKEFLLNDLRTTIETLEQKVAGFEKAEEERIAAMVSVIPPDEEPSSEETSEETVVETESEVSEETVETAAE